jgi:hypothetical protein
MRKLLSLILLALMLAPTHVRAARSQHSSADTTSKSKLTAKESVRLRAHGRRILLTVGGKTQSLDLGDKLSAARLDSVKLIFVTRRSDFNYLLVDARGTSKLKQDMHECGAGEEYDLLWLKLTTNWRLIEARGARYESCWGSTTSDDGYRVENNVLHIAYSDFQRKLECRLTYDADQPERGYTLEESEMKDNQLD